MFSFLEKLAYWILNFQGIHSHVVRGSLGTLHYYDAKGKGPLPPIVLFHGIASSAMSYAGFIQGLRKYHSRVIALDAPGHGRSYQPSIPLNVELLFQGLEEIIAEVIDEPFFLFGNSLGGALALRFSSEHPKRVLGLILSSSAGSRMKREEFERLHSLFKVKDQKSARVFLDHLYHNPPWYRTIIEKWMIKLIGRPIIQSFFENLAAGDHNEHAFSPKVLSSLTMPVLCLWGKSEKLLPLSSYEYFQAHLPKHTEFKRPDFFPHSPHIEFHKKLTFEVYTFIQKTLADRGKEGKLHSIIDGNIG